MPISLPLSSKPKGDEERARRFGGEAGGAKGCGGTTDAERIRGGGWAGAIAADCHAALDEGEVEDPENTEPRAAADLIDPPPPVGLVRPAPKGAAAGAPGAQQPVTPPKTPPKGPPAASSAAPPPPSRRICSSKARRPCVQAAATRSICGNHRQGPSWRPRASSPK